MQIIFKAKPQERQLIQTLEVVPVYYIPTITRNHCNMGEARNSKQYGAYANSDLFLSIVRRAVKEKYGDYILACAPEVTAKGFLSTITLEV